MHSTRLFPVDSIEIGVRYRSQTDLAKEKKCMSVIALIASFFLIVAITIVILAGMVPPKLEKLGEIETVLEEINDSTTKMVTEKESWIVEAKVNHRIQFTNNLNEIINNFNIIHKKRIDHSVVVKKKTIADKVYQMKRMIKILKKIEHTENMYS